MKFWKLLTVPAVLLLGVVLAVPAFANGLSNARAPTVTMMGYARSCVGCCLARAVIWKLAQATLRWAQGSLFVQTGSL